ncbi:MAG: glycine--tRNA ligase [Verrucomicrobiales bacterium]|nr:glycine--tRNA ligase [Verrucomicrobiales bacterium]
MADARVNALMEKIVSLCKRRGFIYQSSEIYGGIGGFWDYGPLGAELKRNVKDLWWRTLVHEREDVAGLEATIIMAPQIWKASGHVDTFSDPMVDCKTCQGRFRADQLDDIPCPQRPSKMVSQCEGEKTEARPFNLMFETNVGPLKDAASVAYLRPETAQAIFVQFKNVLETSRQRVPFGIAQIGKAFRNEVTPRNFTFRSREFEQMELEFFIRPDEVIEAICGRVATVAEGSWQGEPQPDWGWEVWHKYWVEQRLRFYESIGLPRATLKEYWQAPEELAHYARATVDILFTFPFSKRDARGELIGEELEGIAARSDFDLSQHQRFSGKAMTVFDEELKAAWAKLEPGRQTELARRYAEARQQYLTRMAATPEEAEQAAAQARADAEALAKGSYVPHVIEPSAGVDRLILALITHAYAEDEAPDDKGKLEKRVVMRFHPRIAPVKVAVFPLLKNRPELVAKAREVRDLLRPLMTVFYDDAGAIGRRYRRQDEAGTPFGITIDFDTLGEKGPELKDTVTLRDRDSMKQERIPIHELPARLLSQVR